MSQIFTWDLLNVWWHLLKVYWHPRKILFIILFILFSVVWWHLLNVCWTSGDILNTVYTSLTPNFQQMSPDLPTDLESVMSSEAMMCLLKIDLERLLNVWWHLFIDICGKFCIYYSTNVARPSTDQPDVSRHINQMSPSTYHDDDNNNHVWRHLVKIST